jgi:hypothetical protein
MVVLLMIRVKCSCLRAKSAKVSGHLPTSADLVIALKVRRNQPEASNFAFEVRSIQKPHGWSRFWSRGFDVRDENLCHLFSTEKCPVVVKRSWTLEIVSNLHLQKIALKVRRDGPQPSIFVRSFSAITMTALGLGARGRWSERKYLLSEAMDREYLHLAHSPAFRSTKKWACAHGPPDEAGHDGAGVVVCGS